MIVCHYGEFQPVQSALSRPVFASLKQPRADALIRAGRAYADDDVHVVMIAPVRTAIGPQPADQLSVIFGDKGLLVVALSWTLSIKMLSTGITQRFGEAFQEFRREFFTVRLFGRGR